MERRHVVFDFDGVLCDSEAAATAQYEALQSKDFPALPRLNGRRLSAVISGRYSEALVPWLPPDQARAFFDAHARGMRAAASELRLFGGIPELLAQLPATAASIVSGAEPEVVAEVLRLSGVDADALSCIVCRHEVGPKVVGIRHALKTADVKPEQALYVGDTVDDVVHCRDVPIDMLAVSYGYECHDALAAHRPRWLVGTPEDLSTTVRRLLGP